MKHKIADLKVGAIESFGEVRRELNKAGREFGSVVKSEYRKDVDKMSALLKKIKGYIA